MTMSMESFTEPLEAIAAAQYGDAWPTLSTFTRTMHKQSLLEVLQPGLQMIIDAVNVELDVAQARLGNVWDEGLSAGCDRWCDSREFGEPPVNPYRSAVESA